MNSPVEPTDCLSHLEEKMDKMVLEMQGVIFNTKFNNRMLKKKLDKAYRRKSLSLRHYI